MKKTILLASILIIATVSCTKVEKADITVCDLNLMEIPPEDILKMNIEMTIVDGKIVYERLVD